MTVHKNPDTFSNKKTQGLLELVETVLRSSDFGAVADCIIDTVSRVTGAESSFLYLADTGPPSARFFFRGVPPESQPDIVNFCAGRFDGISERDDTEAVTFTVARDSEAAIPFIVFPLRTEESPFGLLGLAVDEKAAASDFIGRILQIAAAAVAGVNRRMKTEHELSNMNKYLTVSSMLAQSFDLHELLGITLNCCTEATGAEAASVLLLDDEKKQFSFYEVEGPARTVLMTSTFPADQGIAGSVLRSQQPEIVTDVRSDPRFYGRIDSESGFSTRNMVAIPLTAGEEKIGVLEVLNKTGEESFTADDHLFLLLVAEEIAFAIRNAKVFDYVVNSYCRQRQGYASCKGCKRPLGTWTPCVKYQNNSRDITA